MKIPYIILSAIFALSLFTAIPSLAGSPEGRKKAARYMKALPQKSGRTPASVKNGKVAKRTPAAKKAKKAKKAIHKKAKAKSKKSKRA